MDYFSNRSQYASTLELQGSNDDFVSEIVTLKTIGEEIHEGWNNYELPSIATYSAYRLFNSQNKGCDDIGELKLYGQTVFEFNGGAATCVVELINMESS